MDRRSSIFGGGGGTGNFGLLEKYEVVDSRTWTLS